LGGKTTAWGVKQQLGRWNNGQGGGTTAWGVKPSEKLVDSKRGKMSKTDSISVNQKFDALSRSENIAIDFISFPLIKYIANQSYSIIISYYTWRII
jgi:hypothetical protein